MNQSSVGLPFVKSILPAHLAPYAHLLTFVVNNRLSWLDSNNRENALLLSMEVLGKVWKKWQENPGAYTEAQFCAYVKKSVNGMVLKRFAEQISQRKAQLQEYKEDQGAKREEEEEIAGLRQTSSLSPIASKFTMQSVASLVRFQTQEAQEEWEDNHFTYSVPDDTLMTDEDGNVGYGGGDRSASNPIDRLMLLLPNRERSMLQHGGDGRTAAVSREWGISRGRGQQIYQSGMKRLNEAIERLQSGEKYEDLLHECEKSEAVAAKKAETIKRHQEFMQFCDTHRLDNLSVHARNFFDAYSSWIDSGAFDDEGYLTFCRAEGYNPEWDDAFDAYTTHLHSVLYLQPPIEKK